MDCRNIYKLVGTLNIKMDVKEGYCETPGLGFDYTWKVMEPKIVDSGSHNQTSSGCSCACALKNARFNVKLGR